MRKPEVLGVSLAAYSMNEIVDQVNAAIRAGATMTVFPVNVNVVMKSRRNPEFRSILNNATIATSDGVPIVWASAFLGSPLPEKKTGWMLFEEICRISACEGHRLFFLGGAQGIPDRAAAYMTSKYPGLSVAGVYSPPPGFESDPAENQKVINLINEAGPQIAFIGLGAVKQETWIMKNREHLRVNVFVAVGGSFDFYAGRVRKPPLPVVRAGLGWLWRMTQEPRRLWKRYLVEDSPFFFYVLRERVLGRGSMGDEVKKSPIESGGG